MANSAMLQGDDMANHSKYPHQLCGFIKFTFIALAIVAGVGCSPEPEPSRAVPPSPGPDIQALENRESLNVDFSPIVRQYQPVVVSIMVSGSARAAEINPNDPFQEFGRDSTPAQPQSGIGTGFIVGSDGLILTNAHVVSVAETIIVRLSDRREFPAKLLGLDRNTDIAVLKIDARDLPVASIGSVEQTNVGEPVLAIGSPYGLESTATSGIISAKARYLPDGTFVPFLQTDAAINPGNSGGPLINNKGKVVGINSQIFSHTGGFQGLAFAIPIDLAMKVTDQLVKHGEVNQGYLGIMIQEITQQLAQSFGLKEIRGALISHVAEGGPADRAGLKAGDVIVSVDQKPVAQAADLPSHVAYLPPGSSVDFEVVRKGQTRTFEVEVQGSR